MTDLSPDPTPACEQDGVTIAYLHDRIERLEGRDDWQGRALAAEAAADGYRQRAERAEAALTPIRRHAEAHAITAKANGRDDRGWLDLLILLERAALSAPEPVDGSAHRPDTDNAAGGHADTTTGAP